MPSKIEVSYSCLVYNALLSSTSSKSRFVGVSSSYEATFSTHQTFDLCPCPTVAQPLKIKISKRTAWCIRSSTSGSGLGVPPGSSSNSTRLVNAIQKLRIKLNARFEELKRGFPLKVLFFLVGIYTATACSTVIGQTGDWDILSAGLAVLVVEGIGAVMYKDSLRLLKEIRSIVTFFNYWKAGLTLGLFLDAFKY